MSFYQGGCPIYFGSGDVAEKVAILNALLRHFSSEGVQPQYVDVRFVESPFYSY